MTQLMIRTSKLVVMNINFQKVFTQETEFQTEEREDGVKRMMIRVDKEELRKLMISLDGRKAKGPDDVSGQVIKECNEELIEPIYYINSLESGTMPREWKRANIIPIYESGNRHEPLNYRPVSLTSVICKMCERIIKKQWFEHLEREKLINESQFGFRQGKSCVTNLISFTRE